ncbi:hypothetical protein C8R46DRAFT_962375 [Mycena filopes]|nr:hypothetical protein C8R46DRAFT_962375 [Mycena filopes]
MGQSWMLVNIDKRESEGSWGKLGEALFDGTPGRLGWSLEGGYKLPPWDEMILPFRPGQPLYKETGPMLPQTAAPSLQAAPLVNLPVETIDEIYSHLPLLVDVLCLSASCQVMWAVGRRNIYCRIAAEAARDSWAGDRIICVGDYLNKDDIPDSIWSPDEREELLKYSDMPGTEAAASEPADKTLFAYPFANASWGFNLRHFWFESDIMARIRRPYLDVKVLGQLCRVFDSLPARSLAAPSQTKLKVLRNLSRHEYVRESALLALKAKYADVDIMDNIGFGEVLVTRICLSSVRSLAMRYDGDLHRGVWAGDRFDVVSEDESLDSDVAWCDVSDEVLAEVEAIWRSEYREVLSSADVDSE